MIPAAITPANDAAPVTDEEALTFLATATPEQGLAVMEELAKDAVVFWRIVMMTTLLRSIATHYDLPLAEVQARFERLPIAATFPLLDDVNGCAVIALAVAGLDSRAAGDLPDFALTEH